MARHCFKVQKEFPIRSRLVQIAVVLALLLAVMLGRDNRRLARLAQRGRHSRLAQHSLVHDYCRGGDARQQRVLPGQGRRLPAGEVAGVGLLRAFVPKPPRFRSIASSAPLFARPGAVTVRPDDRGVEKGVFVIRIGIKPANTRAQTP